MEMLSYASTAMVLVGVYLIAVPKIEGQYVMIVADLMWLAFGLLTQQYAIAVQSFVLFLLNVNAVRNWKNQGVGVSKNCIVEKK